MQVRVLDSSYIIDFPGQGFDSTMILKEIERDANTIACHIKNEKLTNWEVCFRFTYNNVNQILIYTRSKSDTKEKYKEIIIHVPVPTKEQISWGVDRKQHVYSSPNHLDHLLRNFNCMAVDYLRFEKCEEYVLDCMKRVINYCFHDGFKVNGVSVKQHHDGIFDQRSST